MTCNDGDHSGVPPTGHDSAPETLAHIERVKTLIGELASDLITRGNKHDASKLAEPEKSMYDTFTPQLKRTVYGSPEYKANLAAMGEGLAHHYAHNRHHPEHFANGINGMTLVDLIEMLADWRAATERNLGGDLAYSLEIQRDRFGIQSQLQEIFANTARFYGWMP